MNKHRHVISEENIYYVTLINDLRCNTNWELIFMGKPLPWPEFQKLYKAGRGENIANMIKSCEEFGFGFFDGEYLYYHAQRLLPVINIKTHPDAYFSYELVEIIEIDDKDYTLKPVVNVTLNGEIYKVILKYQLGLNYRTVKLILEVEDNGDCDDINSLIPALKAAGFNAKQELHEICLTYNKVWIDCINERSKTNYQLGQIIDF